MLAQGKNYPLAVKLGTITPQGADLYSYAADENDSVSVPPERLAVLLQRWGIDIMQVPIDMHTIRIKYVLLHGITISANVVQMVKTEKDMQEMELELNMSWDFSRITGDGSGEVARGAGRTGMINMGNTCYMNSVMQMVFAIPEWQARYAGQADAIHQGCQGDPTQDLPAQLAKLGAGLCSGAYSQAGEPSHGRVCH
jgi:ubiquitin carboxyl-terminal hydrolase 5/13